MIRTRIKACQSRADGMKTGLNTIFRLAAGGEYRGWPLFLLAKSAPCALGKLPEPIQRQVEQEAQPADKVAAKFQHSEAGADEHRGTDQEGKALCPGRHLIEEIAHRAVHADHPEGD